MATGPGVGIPASDLCQALGTAQSRGSAKPCQICAWSPFGSGCLGPSAESQDQSLRRWKGLGWATWGVIHLGSDREIPVIFPRRRRRHGQFVVILRALG